MATVSQSADHFIAAFSRLFSVILFSLKSAGAFLSRDHGRRQLKVRAGQACRERMRAVHPSTSIGVALLAAAVYSTINAMTPPDGS